MTWKIPNPPWLEITTVFPCSVGCYYCPQSVLKAAYRGIPMLTLENFRRVLCNVPKEVIINFAGFAEPFLNPQCVDMIIHAHDSGYRVEVNSTMIGFSDEDAARIAHIPFVFFMQHDVGLPQRDYPFVDVFHKVTVPTSRAGNLYREQRREGTGTCVRSAEHQVNVMLPNGDVVLCCNDYALKHKLGNLLETNLDQMAREPVYELCHWCPDWISTEAIHETQ